MRISTPQFYQQQGRTISDLQTALNKTQMQLSTGQKFSKASDDPIAAASILKLNQAIESTNQYQKNSNLLQNRLSFEESVLDSVGNNLQRVKELTLQANNATQTPETRAMIATELRETLDALLDSANSKTANGEYLFSGFKSQTLPFSREADGSFKYNGDENQRFLQISNTRQIAIGHSGSEVFRAIDTGNGTFEVGAAALNQGSGIIDPGTVVNSSAYDSDRYQVTMAVNASATADGTVGTITDGNVGNTLEYELRINGSLVYSQNEGSAPLTNLSELADFINDESATTSVIAYVDNDKLLLSNIPPRSEPIELSETLNTTAGVPEDADRMTGYFGSVLTGASGASNTITFENEADTYVVTSSSGNVVSSGDYQSGQAISFSGIQTEVSGNPEIGDQFTINPSSRQDIFTTIDKLITTLESSEGATLNNGVNSALTSLDKAMTNISMVRTSTGTRLSTVENQQSSNEDFLLNMKSQVSELKDIDYAEVISRFQAQLTGLEAAYQSFTKVQGLSLFNYIR